MGLDGVELVMEIEDEFNIKLDDVETGQTRTVGQLIALVEHNFTPQARQRLGPAFYRVRQVLADSALFDKRLIRPSTDLRPFIPREQAHEVWDELREAGFSVPDLAYSRLGFVVFCSTWIAMIILGNKAAIYLTGWSGVGIAAGVAMFFLGWFPASWLVERLSWALLPSLQSIPASYATAGAIARRWSGLADESAMSSDIQPVSGATEAEVEEGCGSEAGEVMDINAERAARALSSLREVLVETIGQAAGQAAPSAQLGKVIQPRDRWRVWESLKRAGAPVMPLQLGSLVRSLIALPLVIVSLVGAVLILVMSLLLVDAGWFGEALLTSIVGLTLVLLIASAVQNGLAGFGRAHQIWWIVSGIPKEWKTLDDAARWLADHGWPHIPPPHRIRSRNTALRVRQIVADHMGWPLDRIQPETRFVEDLGF